MTHRTTSRKNAILLDHLSGFDFEDLMVDVFRHRGYEIVCHGKRTGDEGRDIIMKEPVEEGEKRLVIVECKHTKKVGRPVIQKIHSAVDTYPFEGEKKGVVVTSGHFLSTAIEYADKVNRNAERTFIVLIDGEDLRRIGEEIGLNWYNGKIEIICNDTLSPPADKEDVIKTVKEAFLTINGLNEKYITPLEFSLEFLPTLYVTAKVEAKFKVSVGTIHERTIHQINEKDKSFFLAMSDVLKLEGQKAEKLVYENLDHSIAIDEREFEARYPNIKVFRFGKSETDYKEQIIEILRKKHEKMVSYPSKKGGIRDKKCTPKKSDITLLGITPRYVPLVKTSTTIKKYTYSYEYLSAHPKSVEYKNGIHRCVHCDTGAQKKYFSTNFGTSPYTFCKNCGSINCAFHTKVERLEQKPVCIGCSLTEKFFYKKKYFYNQENLEKFRKIYESMPYHQKAMENPLLIWELIFLAMFIFIITCAII